jgi:glycosyltransferase involved in cell wall biosynthesis
MKKMNKLKNVVIICEFAQFSGGSQIIAINSAIELDKRGYNVIYITAIGEECSELKNSHVKVVNFHIPNITTDENRLAAVKRGLWNKEAAKRYKTIILSLNKNETIVHIHSWSNAFSSSIIKESTELGYKTIITLHDYLTVCPNGGFYNYHNKHICKYDPMSIKCVICNCDRRSYPQKVYRVIRELIQNKNVRYNDKIHYIAISDLNEKLIRPRVSSDKFYRVENFVNVDRSNRHKENNNNKIFICVGRVVEEKGVDIFCKAIKKAKKIEPEIKGIVLGNGPLLEKLKRMYPEVEFLGWVDHMIVDKYMVNARCLVFPSVLYECSPLTIIEALSKGLPCIASDCTTATELIKNGVNGFLFKAENSDSLKNAILKSLDHNVYQEICQNINSKFEPNKYTCESHVNKLIEVYNTILEK